jgi:Trk-type K+ transport systems, membrane components
VGGIGIILVVLSVLISPGTTESRMYKANYGDMKIKPTVIATTRTLGKVYIIITLVSIVLLLMSGMSLFDSICHALCCVSTDGFSTRSESIGAYQGSMIPAAVSISCLMGAVSFVLYPYLFKKPEKFFKNLELRAFLVFTTIGAILFAFTLAKEKKDESIAKELAETLDCTLINAEGTRPDILEKADISNTDAVVACTNRSE